MSRCLIAIPTLNGPDRLRRLLDSIKECTDLSPDITVLVADDGSTDENLQLNKDAVHHFGCEMLTTDRRLGISTNWNRLIHHVPSAETIILCNDDIEVVPHWLDVLRFSVEQNETAGMVALNAYTGAMKSMWPNQPHIDYHEAHLQDGGGTLLASNGFCFAFRRELWTKVGGFDMRYFVFYEEVDFGCSLRELGYRHYIADYPTIFHLGGATNSDKRNLDAEAKMTESRRKFREKWLATPEELRKRFGNSPRPENLREWNTQLRFLVA